MRNKTFKIGITGGIGSGKSLICKIFSAFGVPVYDADSRARWLTNNHPNLISSLKNIFGEKAYTANQELDRSFISNIVFKEPSKLTILNELVHPLVALDFDTWVKKNEENRYVLKEAALIFESGSNESLDKVINVSAPEALRLQRVLLRDVHRNKEQVLEIMAKQLKEEERKAKADFNIINDGSALVIPQVWKLHQLLNKLGQD